MSHICRECGQVVPAKAAPAVPTQTKSPFRGDRKETWEDVRAEIMRTFFPPTMERPVVIGRVTAHFRCGDQEAEKVLDWMRESGDIREITEDEQRKFDVRFGYFRA